VQNRKQGRKKEVGVRKRWVPSLDEVFRDGPHTQYLSQHGPILLDMREQLQYPPLGMFTYKDLT
jgi:hypothetical protein